MMTKFKEIPSNWKESINSIWLFSRLGIRRNIENYKFPGKMTVDERCSLRDVIYKILQKCPQIKSPSFFSSSELEPLAKDYLYEHFLNPTSIQYIHQGEGVCCANKGRLFCQLNSEDHLRLSIVDKSNDLFDLWKELVACELFLEKELGFSFNSRFGFLTAHPEECGTGVDAHAFLQLPALIYTGEFEKYSKEHEILCLESLDGTTDQFIGDLVVLKNHSSLGFKEENLLGQIQDLAIKLVVKEQGLRKTLSKSNDPKLYDLIGRAFGLLKHSYQMDMHEAFDALGKVRLGLDLNWIKNISHKRLNKLLFASRRGHLCISQKISSTDPKEINRERASFFRKAFKRVSFKE